MSRIGGGRLERAEHHRRIVSRDWLSAHLAIVLDEQKSSEQAHSGDNATQHGVGVMNSQL